jgi:hypothetical protein
MSPPEDRRRLTELRAAIASRLQNVCAEWPPEMFDEVIGNLAEITLRYEGSTPRDLEPGGTTDRMLAEMRELARKSAELRKQ